MKSVDEPLIKDQQAWTVDDSTTTSGDVPDIFSGRKEKNWLTSPLSSFESNCFLDPKHVGNTLQGYICRGKKIDVDSLENRSKLNELSKSWNCSDEDVKEKISKWPQTACIKVSIKVLMDKRLSIQGKYCAENIKREMQILKRLSKIDACPDSYVPFQKKKKKYNTLFCLMYTCVDVLFPCTYTCEHISKMNAGFCKYLTHWETPQRYYLAMEDGESKWQHVTKRISLEQYLTFLLHPFERKQPIAKFQKLARDKRVESDTFCCNNKTYLELSIAQRIFSKMADILHWLHSQRVAHLDISLGSFVINGRGSVQDPLIKLTNFGVARDYMNVPDEAIHHFECVGKKEYMAPE
ncbi:hypothetical protein RFI_07101, partial [Reticulomyxa filosa]